MIRFPLLFVPLLATATFSSNARDHFLVIAGGQAAANNQVSLEKNVLFFRKVANEKAPDAPLTEFFSSGNQDIRSVQFEPTESRVPEANSLMAGLFGTTRYLNLEYRKHELGAVDGITSPANVSQWFEQNRAEFQAGDRLILYVTAHGGRAANKSKPHNTRIYMWARQTLDVRTLQENLEKLPEEISVVLVMAQCYSGGFAHAAFKEADPEAGDFEIPLCGFFATVNSRESAGCTPDINEENYDEFSSHFWAAIRGETRVGDPVRGADYDGSGGVSFEEAWAYTILTSRNIDIPMKTSGAFLRARSHYHGDEGVKNDKLLKQRLPYSKVMELADPVERKILEGLSERLKLEGESRYAAAEKKAGEIEKKRSDLKKEFEEKRRVAQGHRDAIRDLLYGRWPELSNLQTEQSVALVSEQSEEFVGAAKGHPRFAQWEKVGKEREEIDKERFRLDKEWAGYIRFLRTHNNIVLRENLRTLGNADDLARFGEIREAEKSGLGAVR